MYCTDRIQGKISTPPERLPLAQRCPQFKFANTHTCIHTNTQARRHSITQKHTQIALEQTHRAHTHTQALRRDSLTFWTETVSTFITGVLNSRSTRLSDKMWASGFLSECHWLFTSRLGFHARWLCEPPVTLFTSRLPKCPEMLTQFVKQSGALQRFTRFTRWEGTDTF